MIAIALALSASLIWGVADFMAAIRARNIGPLVVALFAQTVGTVFLVVLLVVLRDPFPGTSIWFPALVAGVFGGVGHVLFYAALSRGPMGVIAPILALSSAGPVIFSVVWQGERPSALQVIGLVLAVLGVVLVSRQKVVAAESAGSRYVAIPLALLAIVVITVFYIGLDAASNESPLWGVAATRVLSLPLLAVGFVITLLLLGASRPPRGSFRTVAPIGVMDTAALLLLAFATSLGSFGLAVVLASLYPVVTVLLARFRLGEQLAPIQRVGAVVTFVGVAAIVAG